MFINNYRRGSSYCRCRPQRYFQNLCARDVRRLILVHLVNFDRCHTPTQLCDRLDWNMSYKLHLKMEKNNIIKEKYQYKVEQLDYRQTTMDTITHQQAHKTSCLRISKGTWSYC